MKIWVLLVLFLMIISCKTKVETTVPGKGEAILDNQLAEKEGSQLGEYVVKVFEDTKGNLWFATLTKGIAKYDGHTLTYYTSENGFSGNRGGSIVEDDNGDLWFGSHSGISKYDGNTFTHYTEEDGLCDNRISNLLFDKAGVLWIGTWGGMCTFNGSEFIDFIIPKPEIELLPYQSTVDWITEIMEDSKGNIWFARDGYGACKYDGDTFTHFTKKDGLASNNVSDIQEDPQGNIWFSSRITERDHPDEDKRFGSGGLVKYDGATFTSFPDKEGLYNSDVYQIYRDPNGNIWVSTIKEGVYKYDGRRFTNYQDYSGNNPETTFPKPIISILEDRKGNIWLGCAGGLFRLDSGEIINVTTNGPWNE